MKKTISIAAAVVAAMGVAHANTITTSLGSLTCNGSAVGACEAFTGGSPNLNRDPTTLGILSSTTADSYNGQPSSEADEVARLNTLAGTSFIDTDGARTLGNGGSESFSVLGEYIVLRLGRDAIFLRNLIVGGALTIDYTAGRGGGLSHFTEFDRASTVPLPGAAWLMMAGLGGLAAARRKKQSA